MSEMKVGTTARGFGLIEFEDRNGVACTLQESSAADVGSIWLGCEDADPRHLVPGEGWLPYKLIPVEVQFNTRMHLTREQVAALLPVLQQFAETGSLPAKEPEQG